MFSSNSENIIPCYTLAEERNCYFIKEFLILQNIELLVVSLKLCSSRYTFTEECWS